MERQAIEERDWLPATARAASTLAFLGPAQTEVIAKKTEQVQAVHNRERVEELFMASGSRIYIAAASIAHVTKGSLLVRFDSV